MKRLIYLALSLTLLFACTSCVGKAAALPAEAVPTAAQPPELAVSYTHLTLPTILLV